MLLFSTIGHAVKGHFIMVCPCLSPPPPPRILAIFQITPRRKFKTQMMHFWTIWKVGCFCDDLQDGFLGYGCRGFQTLNPPPPSPYVATLSVKYLSQIPLSHVIIVSVAQIGGNMFVVLIASRKLYVHSSLRMFSYSSMLFLSVHTCMTS